MYGTHNGYQSQSRGWGVEEQGSIVCFCFVARPFAVTAAVCLQGMHELFVLAGYEDNSVCLENQRYSVTDQLNMGLRWIELDIWWTFGYDDVRLCHDPFGDPRLIYWVERAANETNTSIPVWDPANLGTLLLLSLLFLVYSQTLTPRGSAGCYAEHNNPLIEGLREIDAWLQRPGNEDEIVVVYYDTKTQFTQTKVEWSVYPALEVFGDRLFTPAEKDAYRILTPSPLSLPRAGSISSAPSQILPHAVADCERAACAWQASHRGERGRSVSGQRLCHGEYLHAGAVVLRPGRLAVRLQPTPSVPFLRTRWHPLSLRHGVLPGPRRVDQEGARRQRAVGRQGQRQRAGS